MNRTTSIIIISTLVILTTAGCVYGYQITRPRHTTIISPTVINPTPVTAPVPKKPTYADGTFTFEYPETYQISKNHPPIYITKVGSIDAPPSAVIARSHATMDAEVARLSKGWNVQLLENLSLACGTGKKLVRSTHDEVLNITVTDTRYLFEHAEQFVTISGYEDLDWTNLYSIAQSFRFTDCTR